MYRHTLGGIVLLTVNGETRELPALKTLDQLLEHMGVAGTVAIELNGQVIRRDEQSGTALSGGDQLEIIHFVGGG